MTSKESTYRSRVIDQELQDLLAAVGAIVIEGPKACGKTATASRYARTVVNLDRDVNAQLMASVSPSELLKGETPVLLDEWQIAPQMWNEVRHQVDERSPHKGQFILTGSSTPDDDARRHSGAGRFARLQMRPMSILELGFSSAQVSFSALMAGEKCDGQGDPLPVADLARIIVRGGWPGSLELDDAAAALVNLGYIDQIIEVDIPRLAERRRDSVKLRRLMQSLARSVGNQISVSKLANETAGDSATLDRATVDIYLDELTRLNIIEDLPAWNTHLRSRASLTKVPKRMFMDPSLAVAALGTGTNAILNDLEYMGFLFENMVVRDLRVLAQPLGGKVFYARTHDGKEVDAVVELRDGTWAAFEVKLGASWIESGAQSLLKFASNVDKSKAGDPRALVVIVPDGYAYQRPDGVTVLPLSALGV
ncbi:ATP-binding protein [Leucobacter sp. OH1287]|uniref:ATP-binding protein n=1 Tax=Leucobacter sp. OH1287 TaxID=2491049 RepID=UPI000F5DA602|nr:DUF4143 domain-containing protein [Leucobacter sp. OH1287]RRD59764.1 ATP-binding protein [Leucobacter sp. OH1287]